MSEDNELAASGLREAKSTVAHNPSNAQGWRNLAIEAGARADKAEAALAIANERAATIAEGCQTFEWKGGEEWAAGFVDGKNAAAAAIRSGEKA